MRRSAASQAESRSGIGVACAGRRFSLATLASRFERRPGTEIPPRSSKHGEDSEVAEGCYLQSGWQGRVGAAALKERRGGRGDSPWMPARDEGDSSSGTSPRQVGAGGRLLPRWFPRRLHSASVFCLDRWAEEASERALVCNRHIVYGFSGWVPAYERENRGGHEKGLQVSG